MSFCGSVFYNYHIIVMPKYINSDSAVSVLPSSCLKFGSRVFKLCVWKCGLGGGGAESNAIRVGKRPRLGPGKRI